MENKVLRYLKIIKNQAIGLFHLYWSLKGKFSRRVMAKPYEIIYVPLEKIIYKYEPAAKRKYKRNLWHKIFMTTHKPGIIADGNWDLTGQTRIIGDLYSVKGFYQRFVDNKDWEDTQYYSEFLSHISTRGHKRRCTSWPEYKAKHLERWGIIYENIKCDGYKNQAALEGKPTGEVRVVVARDGEIMFVDGRHRLAIAKILGLASIPVLVNVWHKQFINRVIDLTGRRKVTPGEAIAHILNQDRLT